MALNQIVDLLDDLINDLKEIIDGDPGPLDDPAKTNAINKANSADDEAAEAQTDSNISSLTPVILFTGWSTNAATCAGEIKTYSQAAKDELGESSPDYQVVADNIATVRNGIPVVKSDINGFG